MQCAMKHKAFMAQETKNSEVFLDLKKLGTYQSIYTCACKV